MVEKVTRLVEKEEYWYKCDNCKKQLVDSDSRKGRYQRGMIIVKNNLVRESYDDLPITFCSKKCLKEYYSKGEINEKR
jgi:hypothetical protein